MDPVTIFRSTKENSKKRFLNVFECPIRDLKCNDKIWRLIRNIKGRLRTIQDIIVRRDESGLTEILFAFRMNPSASRKSAYERYTGQEPNTMNRIVTNRGHFLPEMRVFELNDKDFESGCSTILVRERARGIKLEGAYRKRTWKL